MTRRGFEALVGFIDTGNVDLERVTPDVICESLEAAMICRADHLSLALSKHLEDILDVEIACRVLEIATEFELKELSERCCSMMDTDAAKFLRREDFLHLTPAAIARVLSRNTFHAEEIEIF